MADFFDMGGYAAFVWPAFGLTFLVMAIMVATTLRRLRANQRELARLEASGARRTRGQAHTAGAEQKAAAEQRGVEA